MGNGSGVSRGDRNRNAKLSRLRELTAWARRSEDLTYDKTDEKDAVLIARLTAQLRCYLPEPVDETWGRLRHLGARREQLIVEMVSHVQQMRALLECVWPASLDTAQQPFRSRTWAAAMSVICERDGGDLVRTRRLGAARFEAASRREIYPTRRAETVAANRAPAVHCTHRPGWCHRPPGRRDGTRRVPAAGLAGRQPQAHRHRKPHGRRPQRTSADRAGHLDHRHLGGRCRGHPGRDRGSTPLRHRPGAGQARRTRTPRETVRHLRRPHQTHRPGEARADPDCASRPGARSGAPNAPTPSTAPATDT